MSVPKEASKIVLNKNPTGEVNYSWGSEDSTFRVEKSELQQPGESEILVKVLYLSNDPAQRNWLSKPEDPNRIYVEPVKENEIVKAFGIGEVLQSKSSKFAVGDKVSGSFGWAKYVVVNESAIINKIDESLGFPLPLYLGPIGLNGLTAYFGLKKVGNIQPGQTVVVSAASGATGYLVVQLCKHVFGAKRVIGITGSDEKCKWIESLGADASVNYKDHDYKKKLSDILGDDYIDLYFDNVGGDMLSFMLTKIRQFGVVAACGAIAGYNDSSKLVVSNTSEIVINRLKLQGFIVLDYRSEYPQALGEIIGAIKSGKVKVEEGSTIVDISGKDVTAIPEVWSQLFSSDKGNGKLITKLA